MSTMTEILALIVSTLGSLYLLIIVLRFLFQLVRADFYNPISQLVAKATNPLLMPLRRVIPGFYGIDFASLLLALLVQWVIIMIVLVLYGHGLVYALQAILWAVVGVLSTLFNIYFWGLLITIIASWVAPHSNHPALALLRQIIEPAMKPLRKIIPPIGGIDISPIFAFLILQILNRYLLAALAQSVHMPSGLVPGL